VVTSLPIVPKQKGLFFCVEKKFTYFMREFVFSYIHINMTLRKFGTFKKKFKFGKKSEPQEVKGRDIGIVMGVTHTGHAGFDASKGMLYCVIDFLWLKSKHTIGKFDTRGLPPQLQGLFDAVERALATAGATGITADEAKEILKMAAR
jgi:hypothetical protein